MKALPPNPFILHVAHCAITRWTTLARPFDE